MLDVLSGFIQELRATGIPVSMVEAIDAMNALEYTDVGDRAAFKATLGATLVKNVRHYEAFETAFEVYFALQRPTEAATDGRDEPSGLESEFQPGETGGGGGDAQIQSGRASCRERV